MLSSDSCYGVQNKTKQVKIMYIQGHSVQVIIIVVIVVVSELGIEKTSVIHHILMFRWNPL